MKDKNTDHGKKFTFNENVTYCFSDMLERSIPSYDLMRKLISMLIDKYIYKDALIVDIGTSTGEVIYDLAKRHKNTNFIGIENSDSMIKEASKRFSDFSNVAIKKHDLRNRLYIPDTADVIISCLTIQFTPIEYRLNILKNMYDLLEEKGIFIFVEKVIGNSAEINDDFVNMYYNIKINNGYSYEEIERKKLSLEGILVPVTAKWNEEMLRMSGFTKIDCFWRCLNFSGWIAMK